MRALIIILIVLVGCKAPNFYRLGIKQYLLPIIDVPESRRHSFLSQGVFINQTFRTKNEFGPIPPIWEIEMVIFYKNRTAREWYCLSQRRLDGRGLDSLLSNYFSQVDKLPQYYKVKNDTLLTTSAFAHYIMGPISFLTNDTISISSVYHASSSFNIGQWYEFVNSQYKIDTLEKKAYLLNPIDYYKSFRNLVVASDSVVLNKRSTSQLPLRSKSGKLVYDFHPYKIPPYEKSSYINYWHPFKAWSARLDSINAGLRPPEVYVPR